MSDNANHGRGYLLIIGGGRAYNDNKDGPASWTASVYNWMLDKTPSGKIAVLDRVDDEITDVYVDLFRKLGFANAYKVIPGTREIADAQETYEALSAAEGFYIVGGDQWRHILTWKGTKTEQAIKEVFSKGGVVSGSSSGAHVLSEFILDARESIEHGGRPFWSDYSLMNPYDVGHTFTNDFLGLLGDAIVDTHTTERGRLGRMAASLTRVNTDYDRDVLCVGIDKFTGFAVNPDLTAEVLGHGYVMLMSLSPDSIVHCAAGEPLAATDIVYHQLTSGFKYDLKAREVIGLPPYAKANPELEPPHKEYSLVELDGFYEESALAGDFFMTGPVYQDKDAYMSGTIVHHRGLQQVPGLVVVPKMYTIDYEVHEEIKWMWANQHSGLSEALALHPGKVGVMIPVYVTAEVDEEGYLYIAETEEKDVTSLIIIDTSTVTAVGLAPHFKGGRSPALVNATLHIITDDLEFDLLKRLVRRLSSRSLGWTMHHEPPRPEAGNETPQAPAGLEAAQKTGMIADLKTETTENR